MMGGPFEVIGSPMMGARFLHGQHTTDNVKLVNALADLEGESILT